MSQEFAERCTQRNFISFTNLNKMTASATAGAGACFRSQSRLRIQNAGWNISKLLWAFPSHLSGEEPAGSILEKGGEAVHHIKTLEA